jgi:16S rRNA (guanine527-N7)-methyltransferase
MSGAIEDAVASLELAPAVRDRIARYVELLLAENEHVNLTSARDAGAVLEHVRDSLTLAPYARGPLVDVGSGGGFPAIPLAIVTGITVTLIEATAKKARFLEAVTHELGLDAVVLADRAEVAAHDPALRERFASATGRAVAAAPAVLELTLPFLAIGGVALLQRGALEYAERTAAQDAAAALGGGLLEELAVPRGRLLIVSKRRPTPERFPRRSGLPERRPLGVSPLASRNGAARAETGTDG